MHAMKRLLSLAVFSAIVWSMPAPAATRAQLEAPLPPASNVVVRILDRARQVAESDVARRYTYDKRAVQDEMDAQGRVVKSTEKHYRVVLVGGLPFSRLVKVQGRDLSPAELEKQNQREEKFRQRVTQVDVKKKAEKKEPWVTAELMDRFEFKVMKREAVQGRPALVLAFVPRPSSARNIQDKMLGRIAGTMWVDEQDYEIARVEAKLKESLSLGWLGVIGSLTRCDLTLERRRMADGVWVNAKHSLWIVARKLFESMRFRTTEESDGFRRE